MCALINRASESSKMMMEADAAKMTTRKLASRLTQCGLPSASQVAEARTYLAIKEKHEVCGQVKSNC